MTNHSDTHEARASALEDLTTGLLLSGSVLTLLILPTTLFPSALRTVLLVFVIAHVALRLWTHRATAQSTKSQEWIQLGVLALLLATLIPLNIAQTRLHGQTRYTQNVRVTEAITRGETLGLTTDATKYGDGFAMTRNKAGTIRVLLILLLMHTAFFTAQRTTPQRRPLQLWLLAAFGTAVAAAGIISRHFFPQGQTLWWIYPTLRDVLPGPLSGFINPNHFAGFVALLIPCALALSISSFSRRRILAGFLALAMTAVMAGGIMASHSRGGLGAFVIGVLSIGALCLLRGRVLAGLFIAAIVTAMAFGLPTLMSDTYRERLGSLLEMKEDDSYRTRMQAWADSRDIVSQYPILGAGANAFRMVYPQSRTASTRARMTHAENEYVQLLTDFGLLGAILFLSILALTLRSLLPGVLALRDSLHAPTLAAAGALCVVASHAVLDFSLHIPLYALAAAIIVGLGSGDERKSPRAARRRDLLAPVILLLVAVICASVWGRRQHIDASQHIRRAGYNKLCRALRWAPTSPQAWRRLGTRALREDTLEARMFGEECLTQAGLYDPMGYRLWHEIGVARLSLGDYAGARKAQLRVQSLKDWYWPEDIIMP